MAGTPLTTTNTTIVSAFQSSLLHQLLLVLVILAVLAVAWNVLRATQLRRAIAAQRLGNNEPTPAITPEPLPRRILRISFGLIWLFDGILQGQSAMPVGLADQVIRPAASSSPGFVQHLVNVGAVIWDNHPIEAAVSSVWIQVGIGLWLLVAPRGRWSQAGALASIGWGLIVWIFGEAFGQIFAPGLSWLFGSPGAVLFYCVAGGLLLLPDRLWASPRTGRIILSGMGLFFLGMAVLQAWPGRGFWQGSSKGHAPGTLLSMLGSMAGTSQPEIFSRWVTDFASFDAGHGFAVNLFVVVALVAIGLGFCSGRRRPSTIALVAACLLCLADWVLIQDFGFFGGLGTDPNSMVPMAIVLVAGYVALSRPTAHVPVPEAAATVTPSWPSRLRLDPGYAFRSLAAAGAVLVVLLGAGPMAFASTNPNADPIVTEATNGMPDVTNTPAPGFNLLDQENHTVTLRSLRGKTIALTFLDPVCTTDCPLIAQEFRQADAALGSRAADTEFIAIAANPLYYSTFYTTAFDREEGLSHVPNWLFLTGTVRQLSQLWDEYGVEVTVSPAGAMVDHSDIAYVIDRFGRTRYVLGADPGPNSTSHGSFVDLLDSEMAHLVAST